VADLGEAVNEMRNNPRGIRYADACKVADAWFGKPRQKGTSHRIWKMPWAGDPRVNLQEGSGGKAKAYQIEQLLKAIDRLDAERAAGERVETPRQAAKLKPRKKKG
jgi:hypothetical protein